ncbi:type II secretion system F family protein [Cetobacterium sp.]|uniref:type II secretion system F family protein n=1 Tax=Cetobacterium sp. TaxID=2071632 RepID=UPI002FC6046B
MNIYTYSGFNSEKQVFQESILVKDKNEFENYLKISDKKLMKLIKVKKFKKLKENDLKNFYLNIGRLLNAGISIKKAIEFQNDFVTDINLKVKYKRIYERLNLGEEIFKILKDEEMITDAELLIAYVANNVGKISEGFLKISHLKEKKQNLKKEIQTALSYPLFILFISTVIIIFIFYLIVPNFISIYNSTQEELPYLTKIIISFYNIASRYYHLIITTFVILLFLIYKYFKKNSLLLRLPILKYFFLEKYIINILENLSLLLNSGLSIDKSIDIVLSSIENRYINQKFISLKNIKNGKSLSLILSNIKEFSQLEINMIKVGEESGKVSSMLEEIAKFRQDNLNIKIKIYLSLAEPILLLIVGLIISCFVVGLYLPILNMSEIIQI